MNEHETGLASQPPAEGADTLTCPIPGCDWSISGGTDESRGTALGDHMRQCH